MWRRGHLGGLVRARRDLLARGQAAGAGAGATWGNLLGRTFLIIAGAFALIVAIDVPFQIWDHRRQLRMTKEEVREELKETEGNPQIKARIRSMQREAARRRMMAEVPKADVIVTNPTHYAVALRYRDEHDARAARGRQGLAADRGAHRSSWRRQRRADAGRAAPGARAVRARRARAGTFPRRCTARWPKCWPGSTSCAARGRRGAAPAGRAAVPVPAELEPGCGVTDEPTEAQSTQRRGVRSRMCGSRVTLQP